MLTTMVGLHPVTGKIWRFHWDGNEMYPFTEEEMRVITEAWEKRCAEWWNADFEREKANASTPTRSVPAAEALAAQADSSAHREVIAAVAEARSRASPDRSGSGGDSGGGAA